MSKPRTGLETVSTVLLTVAAVAVAVVYIYGQLAGRPGEVVEESEVENWQEDIALGIRIGPADAPMVVTEFMDFTCPFCAMVVPVVDSLLSHYPSEVALVFQHFPLDGRPLSLPSAVAVECAERQGKFQPMYRLLFAQQESLGSKAWVILAEEAGIPDLAAFEACVNQPVDSFARIEAGRDLGLRRGVTGTPTFYVNGRRFAGRSFEEFQQVAEKLGLGSRISAFFDPNDPKAGYRHTSWGGGAAGERGRGGGESGGAPAVHGDGGRDDGGGGGGGGPAGGA